MIQKSLRSAFAMSAFALAGTASTASAHIDMLGVVEGRNGDQKARPCEGRNRGSNKVYTFEPGATITLGVNEVVGHDGYFRIAFDNDGQDGFQDPASIDPINPNRYGLNTKCDAAAGTTDKCGKSDFCNVKSSTGGASVLYDNVDPHMTNIVAGKQWIWTVKLPDVECTNCTLQIMQVMEDPPGHGPFDGQGDLYYRCVDIELKRGVGMTPGTVAGPATVNGINCIAMANGQDAGAPVVITDAGAPTGDAAVHSPGAHDAGTTPTSDASAPIATVDGAVAAPDAGIPGAPSAPAEEDSGCSVRGPGEASDSDIAFALASLLGGALVLRRRRRH